MSSFFFLALFSSNRFLPAAILFSSNLFLQVPTACPAAPQFQHVRLAVRVVVVAGPVFLDASKAAIRGGADLAFSCKNAACAFFIRATSFGARHSRAPCPFLPQLKQLSYAGPRSAGPVVAPVEAERPARFAPDSFICRTWFCKAAISVRSPLSPAGVVSERVVLVVVVVARSSRIAVTNAAIVIGGAPSRPPVVSRALCLSCTDP